LLLEYGFSQFQRKKLLSKGQLIASVPVGKGNPAEVAAVAAADLHYPLSPGESRLFHYVINLENYNEAPLREGSPLGRLDAYLGGRLIGRVELLAGHSVNRLTLWQQFNALWRTFLKGYAM
jgi:D-alanyl-D-alanine carboxypeptidase (penicillin-binding protein 5/6)